MRSSYTDNSKTNQTDLSDHDHDDQVLAVIDGRDEPKYVNCAVAIGRDNGTNRQNNVTHDKRENHHNYVNQGRRIDRQALSCRNLRSDISDGRNRNENNYDNQGRFNDKLVLSRRNSRSNIDGWNRNENSYNNQGQFNDWLALSRRNSRGNISGGQNRNEPTNRQVNMGLPGLERLSLSKRRSH